MSKDIGSTDNLAKILALSDETYANIPPEVLLAVDEITKNLPEFGPRKLREKGPGAEFYEARPYREGFDDPRMVNARLSARHGRPIVAEKQAENRQPVFFWRKGHGTTEVVYEGSEFTKKQYMEIALLACAKKIVSKEDMIGVLDGDKTFGGASAVGSVASQFFDVNVIKGNMPVIGRKVPVGSTVILMSDFFAHPAEQAEMARAVDQLRGLGVNGRICMVLDPAEIDFDPFKGHVRFNGKEGEKSYVSEKAEALKQEFNAKMNKYIEWVENLAQSNGYEFILQRTDKPPLELVLKIFGIDPESPAPKLQL